MPAPMTALQLAEWVDRIPPVALKRVLYAQLRWQSQHGRRPGHIRQYVERAYREHVSPRLPVACAEGRARVKALTDQVGNVG